MSWSYRMGFDNIEFCPECRYTKFFITLNRSVSYDGFVESIYKPCRYAFCWHCWSLFHCIVIFHWKRRVETNPHIPYLSNLNFATNKKYYTRKHIFQPRIKSPSIILNYRKKFFQEIPSIRRIHVENNHFFTPLTHSIKSKWNETRNTCDVTWV